MPEENRGNDVVELKMVKEGLMLVIREYEDFEDVETEISRLISSMSGFFSEGDRVMLSIPEGEKYSNDLPGIVSLLQRFGIHVDEVSLSSSGKRSGTRRSSRKLTSTIPELREGTKVLKRNLRSGQLLVHNGSVMIFGNVHSGAEVMAGGSVVIFGSLKGSVKAGLKEGETALIAALDFSPSFLQIAGYVMNEPPCSNVPSVAHVRTGRIVVEPFDNLRFENRGEE